MPPKTRKRASSPPPANTRPKRAKKNDPQPIKSEDEDDQPTQQAPVKKTRTNGKAKAAGKKDVEDDKSVLVDENDATVASQSSKAQFASTSKLIIPVDEKCPYVGTHKVYIDADDGIIYDAALNQTNSGHNNNKFYRIQLLTDGKSFRTWNRWGRVGASGQTADLGATSFEAAFKDFEKKFKDKTGLKWADRASDPKPGKYVFVERSYEPESDHEKEDSKSSAGGSSATSSRRPSLKCTLEPQVESLMELIFNQDYINANMASYDYDANKLPLGRLSKATISRGYATLKRLAALIHDPALAASEYNLSFSDASENLSNAYLSLIPHDFGFRRPPVINNYDLLKKEVGLMDSLTDLKEADEILKAGRDTKDAVHYLDARFKGLNLESCAPLEPKSDEFENISDYLVKTCGTTHNLDYKVVDIFRIERQGESDRFQKSEYAKMPSDRRLLWHGSRATNYGGILSQGLRIAPPEAPVSGYMFGKGIYLADMSSKSANYCASYISGGHALLLLCEAELGDPMQQLTKASYSAGEDAKAKGMHSTWGQGNTGPSKWKDAKRIHENLSGIKMPDTTDEPGATNVAGAFLYYNEYICYDIAQVRLRYLLRVKI